NIENDGRYQCFRITVLQLIGFQLKSQFWPNDPEIWFLQVENQFTLANITSDATKFNYIVANLETAYISEVRYIVVSPPATETYVKLKSELIKRLSASQQQKIKRLLEHEELGDPRPFEFLRHLQSLAGTTVPDNIVRSLWLGRLPSSTQAIYKPSCKEKYLESAGHSASQGREPTDGQEDLRLLKLISEAIAPSVHISEVSNARESTIDNLTAELAEMKIQLASLSQAQAQTNTYRRNRSNSRGRPYPRDSSYSRE
uniref:Uncharacterized protein LOC114348116 n=1 Tax=Diabrotica virgifera virgifera TaxID=50390 RepID=A0A6P7HA55_DIAVI